MKLNKDKCHLLVLGHKHENVWVKMGDEKIWESAKQKLLGMKRGRNLNFDDHMISLCKKAGRKLAVLARLSKFMSFKQKANPYEDTCRVLVWMLLTNLDVS